MDRHVPSTITYWTGIWNPAKEAISSEVDALRRMEGRCDPVVSFSRGQLSSPIPRARVLRLSGARNITLRLVAAALEPFGAVSHVVGGMNAWHLLRAVGRRPILFTVVMPGPPLEAALYAKVRLFAAESESLVRDLRAAGIPDGRIRLVYPGVDLQRFRPTPPPPGRFRVLFASTPSDPLEFSDRGIPVLVSAARSCPDVDFVLAWREWGDQNLAGSTLAALRPPPNLIVQRGDVRDMSAAYSQVHATICMFAAGFGKSCPNSIIEGLACGRPAVVSTSCGIAGLLASASAGCSVERTDVGVAEAVRRLQQEYVLFSARARAAAERYFDRKVFCGTYGKLYRELSSSQCQVPVTTSGFDRAVM